MNAAFDIIATALQVGIGALLALAGGGKVTRWHEFKGTLDAYRLLPASLVRPAACLIVAAEIVIGVALVAGWETGLCAFLACTMFTAFAAAMAINLVRGRRFIDCGCFQGTRQPLEWRLVMRNAVLAVAALGSSGYSLAADDAHRWIQAAPAGVALVVLYFALSAIWSLDASQAAAFKRK